MLILAACGSADTSLPSEWRLPTDDELSAEPQRRDSPTRYARVVADFNSDGTPDEAFLLKSTRFSGEGLLVRLSCGRDCVTWVTLDSTNWGPQSPNVPASMGVDVLPPGNYPYRCVENGVGCEAPPVRSTMTLDAPAISYFRFESAASFFYWKDGRFIRAWTSD